MSKTFDLYYESFNIIFERFVKEKEKIEKDRDLSEVRRAKKLSERR